MSQTICYRLEVGGGLQLALVCRCLRHLVTHALPYRNGTHRTLLHFGNGEETRRSGCVHIRLIGLLSVSLEHDIIDWPF